MTPARPLLRLDDKLAEEKRVLDRLSSRRGRGLLLAAVGTALALHVGLLSMPLPQARPVTKPPPHAAAFPSLVRWIPAPALELGAEAGDPGPPPSTGSAASRDAPAATASSERVAPLEVAPPEPVEEPASLPVRDDLPVEAELPSSPSFPSPTSPAPAAVDENLPPVVAPGGRVAPVYPRAARVLRAEGLVELDVSVRADGSVADVTVVRCTRPGVGFEEAAVAAVRKWRFNPGMSQGRAAAGTVDVTVEFKW